jgi:metallo-beta-lactamase family protein
VKDQKRIPNLPVFIDSPMAVDASHIYCKYGDDHNLDVNLLMNEHACPLRCEQTNFIRNVEDSKILNTKPGPAIIISASGMCSGGRILHHLKWRLPSDRNSVLFVGYQAEGTLGRRLLDGFNRVRIHGEDFPVRARVAQVQALSGHADQKELIRWLSGFNKAPSKVFITHGESQGSQELQKQIGKHFGWEAAIPSRGDSYEI